jgi:hypothetical protein
MLPFFNKYAKKNSKRSANKKKMSTNTTTKTMVWQVCHCEVTDHREYCVTCFPSKSEHRFEAMKDEDTYLRFSDLRVQPLNNNAIPSGTKA